MIISELVETTISNRATLQLSIMKNKSPTGPQRSIPSDAHHKTYASQHIIENTHPLRSMRSVGNPYSKSP